MSRVLQSCPGCARQHDVGALSVGSPVICSCGVRFGVEALRSITPRAMCCSRCGGPLRSDTLVCDYCQAEITMEERLLDSICPACFGRMTSTADYCMSCGVRIDAQPVAALPASASCPRCSAGLRSRRVGAELLVECSACAGLWVDPKLLERLCDDANVRKSVAESLGSAPARESKVKGQVLAYIPCPNCRQPMNRKNFGSISGILIDVCKDHGVWLDHGELRSALTFAETGGLIEARRREVGELERRKQRAAMDASPTAAEMLGSDARGSVLGRSNGGLLGWLARELLG